MQNLLNYRFDVPCLSDLLDIYCVRSEEICRKKSVAAKEEVNSQYICQVTDLISLDCCFSY